MDVPQPPQDWTWLYVLGWPVVGLVDLVTQPVHPESLAAMFVNKSPALLGICLGWAHWYTNQRDRAKSIKNNHELKMTELTRKTCDRATE